MSEQPLHIADLQRRIQLLQDFEMPQVSNCVQISKNGQYILATGVYKPRIRCYDTSQMSMKFERCVDSEIVKFHMLDDDYSKVWCDRFHLFSSTASNILQ